MEKTNSLNLKGQEVFKAILSNENEHSNVFISPLSITLAFALLAEGAEGDSL